MNVFDNGKKPINSVQTTIAACIQVLGLHPLQRSRSLPMSSFDAFGDAWNLRRPFRRFAPDRPSVIGLASGLWTRCAWVGRPRNCLVLIHWPPLWRFSISIRQRRGISR